MATLVRYLIFCFFVLYLLAEVAATFSGNCRSSFSCGDLGEIHFPFTPAESPECGAYTIQGCNDKVQKINTTEEGKWYEIENIYQDNSIVVADRNLEKLVQSQNCNGPFQFGNFALPLSTPLVSFSFMHPLITMIKCNYTSDVVTIPGYDKYLTCHDHRIYYSQKMNVPVPSLVPECSTIEIPEYDPEGNNTSVRNLSEPFLFLTGRYIHIKVIVLDACQKCYNDGGSCQIRTTGSFYCEMKEKKNAKDLKLVLGIVLCFGGAIIISIIAFALWCCKRRNASPDIESKSDMEGGNMYFGVPIFSYIELEKATNHFDHTKELGDGGFGTVYHGKLRDGREVAVKRLYEHSYRRIKQFINEVEILTRLRHKNLVTLYGCTSQRSRELLLVYEYIPNGTVADHLHGDRAKPGSLSWPLRMSIAIETAAALAYLHASDIVHRDVKTNNILLDNSFCVKVADFGLSRLFPNDATHVSTAPQGTPGYVDPEYHECYQLTSKSDVYSFGVVLIELISSLPAVDIGRHRHEINLANLAVNKIQKRAYSELIDPSIGSETDDDVKTMIITVAELAFQCLQLDRDLRPSMEEVLEALKRTQNEKDKATTMDEANVHAEISSNSLQSIQPSPDCGELGSRKCIEPTNSPITVMGNWDSNLTTPNNSS